MLEVPVYDMQGNALEKLQVDPAAFGGEVNAALLKQAVVAYHTNSHQGSANTRGRGDVRGSTRKLFRQKGTGNARRGAPKTNLLRGGGVAFAKPPSPARHTLTKKMRHKALQSAILAKLLGEDLLVVQDLKLDAPKTRTIATLLDKLQVHRSCLLALARRDDVIYRSTRNIPKTAVRTVEELNAWDVAGRQKMVVSRRAMDALLEGAK
ncbi:MAG: 50S ribosomal protein L4 [Planctomycetota bacterium]